MRFIKLNIKTLSGTTTTVEVCENDSVEKIKQKINEKVEVGGADQLRLIYAGKEIMDNELADALGLKNDSSIYMILRLRG